MATSTLIDEDQVLVVPANEASWNDLRLVFGSRGDPATCQCQWFKIRSAEWQSVPVEDKQARLREQTGCDDRRATTTSGLVAYLADEPVGWVAIEPRSRYLARMTTSRLVWAGRNEDKDDDGVWAITCFVVRNGYRHRGIARALAEAAVDHARRNHARAVEAYPINTEPGENVAWGQLYVGSVRMFERAGFEVVTSPTPRRRVVRLNFEQTGQHVE
jgi:ribosomal protein S18 acetylase RimI-like enzyme